MNGFLKRLPVQIDVGGGIAKRRRRRRSIDLLEQSGLFDRDWYLKRYPDVAASGMHPVRHYLEFGWAEGRDPGPRFSTLAYLRENGDVAQSGVNPLLHYIEHGHAEGRGAPEHGRPARRRKRVANAFPPPAPVARFRVETAPPLPWKRSSDPFDAEASFGIDGYFICDCPDGESRELIRSAVEELAFLSGRESADTANVTPCGEVELVDCWHLAGRLRTRWKAASGEQIVARAIHHHGESAALAGEGLVSGELDCVDAVLPNAFFPLLFVFTTVDGRLLGSTLLPFPSLCRGGAHYPEALQLASGEATVRIAEVMDGLRAELLALRSGSAPAVAEIVVDVSGSDGSERIFQPDFREWLECVFRIPVRPGVTGDGRAAAYLAGAVTLAVASPRSGAAALRLSADMIPAISSLVARATGDASADAGSGTALLVATNDSARPAVLLRSPRPLEVLSPAGAVAFPRLLAGEAGSPPVLPLPAIRIVRARPLTDAEMLLPVSGGVEAVDGLPPVTWLVGSRADREQDLLACLESISLQEKIGPSSILLLGQPLPVAEQLARELFGGRVRTDSDLDRAARSITTQLTGYIDPAVVLHDRRSAAWLARILDDPNVETASLPLVTAEQRGRSWTVVPASLGEFDGSSARSTSAFRELAQVAPALWRSTWPVARPPSALWLAKTALVQQWLSAPQPETGRIHLCSFLLSASATRAAGKAKAALPVPKSASGIHYELVV